MDLGLNSGASVWNVGIPSGNSTARQKSLPFTSSPGLEARRGSMCLVVPSAKASGSSRAKLPPGVGEQRPEGFAADSGAAGML